MLDDRSYWLFSYLAAMAGAKGGLIDIVAKRMVEEGDISASRAKEILEEII